MIVELVRDIVGWALILSGSFFVLVGAVGLNRMPDVFTRMHAASVSDSFGAILLLLGMVVAAGFSLVTAKLAFLILFLLFTGPIATHAIARAAIHAGLKPVLAPDGAAAKKEGELSKR